MMKTTANLRLMTIAELRAEADVQNERFAHDRNDTVADCALNRINAELTRRQRLCRAPHGETVCALLVDHGGDHRALSGDRWA